MCVTSVEAFSDVDSEANEGVDLSFDIAKRIQKN